MFDGVGREIDHLRLSLTDRCNLACTYCDPGEDARTTQEPGPSSGSGLPASQDHAHFIDFDFALAVCRWLICEHGIRHIRLTGGEPLLYPRLAELIRSLRNESQLDEITLTTNGQALAAQARRLREAGLTRINVSIDSLRAERFERLSRGGRLEATVRGIDAARIAGLDPIRINVVVQRGENENELIDMTRWALIRGLTIRFLEMMHIGPLANQVEALLVPKAEMVERLQRAFSLKPIRIAPGQPADDFHATDGTLTGTVGIISSTSDPFCERCRRIRVTAAGKLMACLHDANAFHLAPCWNGATLDEAAAEQLLASALAQKKLFGPRNQPLTMLTIGG